MTESTTKTTFTDRGCFPHQSEFAAKFFAPGAPRMHLLVSAPGMGKGFVTAGIINHALSAGGAHRVLVIAPKSLHAQWRDTILRGGATVPVVITDRRLLRELEDAHPVGQEIWPSDVVVILSLDFASRPDVMTLLTRSLWDLLVVDEFQLIPPHTQRSIALSTLTSHDHRTRVLLLRTGEAQPQRVADQPNELVRDAAVTVWTPNSLRDLRGRPLLPEMRMEWVAYRRRPEEAAVLSRLQDAVRSLDTANANTRLVVATLLHSASSSSFALEQRLRRIRQRRNELVHGVAADLVPESDVEEIGLGQPDANSTEDFAKLYLDLSNLAAPLLETLEELPVDSKYEALLRVLGSGGTESPDRRACVFTSFVDTATYLERALTEQLPHIGLLTGSTPLADRERTLQQFAREGGTLISTHVGGAVMPEVPLVVFYDLPVNSAVLKDQIGQFVRVGRRGPIRVVAFTDESDVLGIERAQKRIAEGKEGIGENEVDQLLFPT